MNPGIVFYVSGHGLGHVTRNAEIRRALVALAPETRLYLRPSANLDSGAIEDGSALQVNPRLTLEAVARVLAAREPAIAEEAEFIRSNAITLAVADIPYLAGDIAAAAGIPCIGIGNFTWDWIYEPYFENCPEYAHLKPIVRAGYSKMELYLRLPFSHSDGLEVFPEVREVPLVARLGKAADRGSRPRVLVAMRGGIDKCSLERARETNEFEFLEPDGRHFPDLVRASDAVVSKLGYGTIAECAVNGSALLYPPRTGFREEPLLEAAAARYLRARQIPLADFESGNWAPHLQALLAMPAPAEGLDANGAEVCARIIESRSRA